MKVILVVLFIIGIGLDCHCQTGQTYVRGHMRRDGTYVEGHYRTNPNHTRSDNWSTEGNYNPYTGEEGTRPYYNNYSPTYYSPEPDYYYTPSYYNSPTPVYYEVPVPVYYYVPIPVYSTPEPIYNYPEPSKAEYNYISPSTPTLKQEYSQPAKSDIITDSYGDYNSWTMYFVELFTRTKAPSLSNNVYQEFTYEYKKALTVKTGKSRVILIQQTDGYYNIEGTEYYATLHNSENKFIDIGGADYGVLDIFSVNLITFYSKP